MLLLKSATLGWLASVVAQIITLFIVGATEYVSVLSFVPGQDFALVASDGRMLGTDWLYTISFFLWPVTTFSAYWQLSKAKRLSS